MAYEWVAGLSLAIWVYLLFFRGGFWKVGGLFYSERAVGQARVVVVMAARDEADVIGTAVTSLLGQEFAGWLHVVVVDDSSSDGTAGLALQAARALGREADLTVITGKPLASGWTGKLWALSQGVEAAEPWQADFLLFTDADIRHGTSCVRELVSIAAERQLDLASYMVKLQCRTLPEKLLIPPFVFFFLKLYPPAWIASEKRRTAGAAGGCVLLRPAMLRAIGGLHAIRNELIDDCALARAVKRQGGRIWLGLTDGSESIRPYRRFGEIGRMISRSAFRQLEHSVWLLAGAVAGLVVSYLAPVGLMFAGSRVAGVCYLVMAGVYWPMVRFYKLSGWWCFLLPAAAGFYLGATVFSAVAYWRGRGGVWKGRVQDA
jgi:hopene-associated glycosyltransferase HpnB